MNASPTRWLPYRWPWTTNIVAPGTCLIHGSFAGHACPTCSSGALIPGINVAAPIRLVGAPPANTI